MIKDALILTMITLVSGLLLGFVFEITKKPIAEEQARAKQEAYQKVFTDAKEFKVNDKIDVKSADQVLEKAGLADNVINEVLEAVDGSGETLGYVLSVTSKEGYGGDIQLSVGIQKDGTVNGIEILTISETAGLGMKAADKEFKDQYKDKKVEKFAYTKTKESGDDKIDALSGATITTNAVTNAVNAGICFFQSIVGGGK